MTVNQDLCSNQSYSPLQVCVWTPRDLPALDGQMVAVKPGDYIKVQIEVAGTATLFAEPVCLTRL